MPSLREDIGTAEALATLGSGIVGQVPAGLAGLVEYFRQRGHTRALRQDSGLARERAAARTQRVGDALTYEPRTEAGQERLGQIGTGIEKAGEIMMRAPGAPQVVEGWQNFTAAAPLAAAGIAAGAELLPGPKGVRGVAQKATSEALKKRGLINLKLREKSPEEALAIAQRGEHLVEGGKSTKGAYIGGPRDITSPQKLGGNRARMDRELAKAVGEVEAAGEIPGDWYPSQKRGVASIAEPWQQPRTARGTALMSSQTDPEGERLFLIQAHNRLARGEPVGVVKTGRQGKEFERSAKEGRDIKLGEKTGIYGRLSDPTQEPPAFGTNDFRQAQFQGYTEPSGKPQTSGLKPTQHAFMDAEGLLLTQRARAKALGGRTDWTGSMAQEVPWVVEKANSLQSRFPGRFPKTPEGRNAAIREASKTGEDYNIKHAVGATYERIPGPSTGHDPQIVGAPFAERAAYSEQAPWTREGRDVLYQGQGLLQLPTTQGVGIWEGATNPNVIAQPLADFTRTKAKGTQLTPGMEQQLALAENLRGLVDVQEASAFHIPMTMATRKAGTKSHALLEHGTPKTEAEMRDIAGKLPPGWTPTPSPRGTMLISPHERSTQAARNDLRQIDAMVGPAQRAGMEGGYFDVYRGTTPGQGEATSAFLRRAAESPEASVQGMSESDAVRGAIRGIHQRDVERAAEGATIRPDVQKTRLFLSDADWAKAARLIRQGMTPAAAVAALGYSLSGMAEEEIAR